MGIEGTKDFAYVKAALDRVKEASNGRINITLTGSGSIVADQEMHTAVGKGMLDGCMSTGLYYGGTIPAAQFEFGFPGMSMNMRELLYYRALGFQDVLRGVYKDFGVRLITVTMDPGLDMLSTKPINSLSEMKGLKVRAGGAMGSVLSGAGAAVVMIPATDLYTSLSTKVIDACVYGNITSAMGIGLFEVTQYCVPGIMSHKFGSNFLMNLKLWDSLPNDLKAIVDDTLNFRGIELLIPTQLEIYDALDKFKAKGGKIVNWSAEDYNAMATISLKLMDELAQIHHQK